MQLATLRKLLILLTSLAFIIGVEAQAMASISLIGLSHASAEHVVMRDGCATMKAHDSVGLATMEHEPCKRVSFDCATQLGCICPTALPVPPTALWSPVAWGRFSYWPRLAIPLAGLSIKPTLHPPIAA
jgi:hypothetical protein